MKGLLENVKEIDYLLRNMQKMESKMKVGQWIDAWRECNRIMAYLDSKKQELIKNGQEEETENKETP